MNDNLIACCGLDCSQCDARMATLANDDELRRLVSKRWCEWNHTDQITPESINCLGCRSDGVKFYFCSHLCEIRKCSQSHGYDTCGQCPSKDSCSKLAAIIEDNAVARENLNCK